MADIARNYREKFHGSYRDFCMELEGGMESLCFHVALKAIDFETKADVRNQGSNNGRSECEVTDTEEAGRT